MRRFYLVFFTALIALTACDSTKKPSDTNFTKAINQYLTEHGETCIVIGRQFPLNIPRPEQSDQYAIGPKLVALEQAALVHAIDATATVHGMLDPLRGSTPPQPVKRYELTADGKKYFQQIPGTLGQTGGFCYGQKSVDTIVKWTEPTTGTASQAEVTYTYRIVGLAPWAKQPDIQQEFGDVRRTVNGISKSEEIIDLQLTNQGWEVPVP